MALEAANRIQGESVGAIEIAVFREVDRGALEILRFLEDDGAGRDFADSQVILSHRSAASSGARRFAASIASGVQVG